MPSYKIEQINMSRCKVAEGPHWDISSQSLYFIDGYNSLLPIHRYDYAENKTYSAKLTGIEGNPPVFFIIPIDNEPGHFVISMNHQVAIIEWDGKASEAKFIRKIVTLDKEVVINDAKVDCNGRLYFGSRLNSSDLEVLFERPIGELFKYSKKEQLTSISDGIFISNGLTWNEATNKFYYIDSGKWNIMEYDHDPLTGNITNGRVLIDFKTDEKRPDYLLDGMTIDRDGFLYVALVMNSKIVKINPNTGKVELEIEMPVSQPTSVAFGGPNLDILFVTTAVLQDDLPLPAGLVLKVTNVGVGLPMKKAKV